jgi:hypothetical protein
MRYRIEVSSVAEAEADGAFLWLSQVTSAERVLNVANSDLS